MSFAPVTPRLFSLDLTGNRLLDRAWDCNRKVRQHAGGEKPGAEVLYCRPGAREDASFSPLLPSPANGMVGGAFVDPASIRRFKMKQIAQALCAAAVAFAAVGTPMPRL